LLPLAAAAAGIPFPALMTRLVENVHTVPGTERTYSRNRTSIRVGP
jgi:hypothetical protein